MASMLEVMRGRIGIAEFPGAKANNPTIVGWAAAIGHPEIHDDETSWCSICMCAAAKEAGMPFPSANVNTMARSWLTWGKAVELEDVQPGDVAVWPRGNPNGPYGHVNIVEVVAKDKVICIGGNQSTGKGADAVTRSLPRKKSDAVGFRRGVAPTVPELRKAGSTEIKKGDQVQNTGMAVTFLSSITAAIAEMFGPTQVPHFADVGQGLSWWQGILGGVNAIGGLLAAHPWLAGTVIGGAFLIIIGHQIKAHRVAKAAAGVPLSAEVARLVEA